MSKLFIASVLFLFGIASHAQDTITSTQAKNYLDKIVVVKGKVVSYRLASDGGKTNYINIDKPFPDNDLSIVITNVFLEKLNIKPEALKGKYVYVKGKITLNNKDPKHTPQLFNPSSISLKK